MTSVAGAVYAAPKMAAVEEEAQRFVTAKSLTHGELRTACRERGLSPAGSKHTLEVGTDTC